MNVIDQMGDNEKRRIQGAHFDTAHSKVTL
jgi:hypothetical protein